MVNETDMASLSSRHAKKLPAPPRLKELMRSLAMLDEGVSEEAKRLEEAAYLHSDAKKKGAQQRWAC